MRAPSVSEQSFDGCKLLHSTVGDIIINTTWAINTNTRAAYVCVYRVGRARVRRREAEARASSIYADFVQIFVVLRDVVIKSADGLN